MWLLFGCKCAVQCHIWSHTRLEIGVHVDWQTVCIDSSLPLPDSATYRLGTTDLTHSCLAVCCLHDTLFGSLDVRFIRYLPNADVEETG